MTTFEPILPPSYIQEELSGMKEFSYISTSSEVNENARKKSYKNLDKNSFVEKENALALMRVNARQQRQLPNLLKTKRFVPNKSSHAHKNLIKEANEGYNAQLNELVHNPNGEEDSIKKLTDLLEGDFSSVNEIEEKDGGDEGDVVPTLMDRFPDMGIEVPAPRAIMPRDGKQREIKRPERKTFMERTGFRSVFGDIEQMLVSTLQDMKTPNNNPFTNIEIEDLSESLNQFIDDDGLIVHSQQVTNRIRRAISNKIRTLVPDPDDVQNAEINEYMKSVTNYVRDWLIGM
jgi:hypothetical protein